ncbi:MAG: CoA-binding protein, partial [Rhodoferax sp.]|nr:CoA-binding protein [Rhodoferax sp.]
MNPTTDSNPTPATLQRILRTCRTIAMVGLSADPQRASFGVARYMQERGYRIVPVNPRYAAVGS